MPKQRRRNEVATIMLAWLVAPIALLPALAGGTGQDGLHGQCQNPLFQTHWDGKNDIQTLTAFPYVRTNLRLCQAYNQRASCCHQMFESEQLKYYDAWVRRLREKFERADEHRRSALAAGQLGVVLGAAASKQDREQLEVALSRYEAVLGSASEQSQCLSLMLTYVAGMECFCCRPEWTHYVVLSGNSSAAAAAGTQASQSVIRVRIARSACHELWAACSPFGERVAALNKALRDSALAREAEDSHERLDFFETEEALCAWMHDSIAMHPFRLPTKEGEDFKVSDGRTLPSDAWNARRLQAPHELAIQKDLNVLQDGRATGFDVTWHGPVAPGALSSFGRRLATTSCSSLLPMMLLVVHFATLLAGAA